MHEGGNIDDLLRAGGSVVKTHYPQSIECQGHETEIERFLSQSKVILVKRDPRQILASLDKFGRWGHEEVNKFNQSHEIFGNFWNHKSEVLIVDYSDLICEEKLSEVLQKIEEFSGLRRNRKIKKLINKHSRYRILLFKLVTRLIGKYSPYVITGIKLGK